MYDRQTETSKLLYFSRASFTRRTEEFLFMPKTNKRCSTIQWLLLWPVRNDSRTVSLLGHLWDVLLWLWRSSRTTASFCQVAWHGGAEGMLRCKATRRDTSGPDEAFCSAAPSGRIVLNKLLFTGTGSRAIPLAYYSTCNSS